MRSIVLLVLALALLVAACSGDDSDGASETTTTSPESTTTTSPPTTESTTTTAATTTSAGEADATCLLGEWQLDSQRFFDSVFEIFGGGLGMEEAAFEHVSGTYRVMMAGDGTYTGTRDEWTFRFTIPEGGFQTTIDGTDTGSYAVAGDQLTLFDMTTDTSVTFFAEVDGDVFEVPSGPDVGSDALAGTGTFTCSADTLTVENQGVVSSFARTG